MFWHDNRMGWCPSLSTFCCFAFVKKERQLRKIYNPFLHYSKTEKALKILFFFLLQVLHKLIWQQNVTQVNRSLFIGFIYST